MKDSIKTRNRIKKFYKSYLFIGVILVLTSALVEQLVLPLDFVQKTQIINLIIRILVLFLNSIGIALLVGYWIDMVKNSEDYINFINEELHKTIISREFIQLLGEEEKIKICENLIIPNEQALNNYSNIKSYMNTQAQQFLKFFNVNFRSHYNVYVTVKKDKNNRYYAEYKLSYRIYKINKKYNSVSIMFEKKSNIQSTIIKDEKGQISREIKDSDYKKEMIDGEEKYCFEIPPEFYDSTFLTIERQVVEYGHNHWISLNWMSLTPIDGVEYRLICKDGIIKEWNVFNKPEIFNMEKDPPKKEMTIRTSQWINSYSGFSIIVGEYGEGDD